MFMALSFIIAKKLETVSSLATEERNCGIAVQYKSAQW